MSSKTFLGFLLFNILCALAVGVVIVLSLRAFTENSGMEMRRHLLMNFALNYEKSPDDKNVFEMPPPEPPPGAPPGSFHATAPEMDPRAPHPHRPPHVWVVDADGRVTGGNTRDPLPEPWISLPKPENAHEVSSSYRFLALSPYLVVMRLGTVKPSFLVMTAPRPRQGDNNELFQLFLFGSALAFCALISMLMTFLYLRKKSSEARGVLLRLERGDLKARFSIKQFDQMGSLMLDFNRMASEIERLVGKLAEAEQARKTFFQELSHDLRTPLTSLRTSIETLSSHWAQMPAAERIQIVSVCQAEISYFTDLLENLLFIAQMDEPLYKKTTEIVDLRAILEGEIQVRKAQEIASSERIAWSLRLLGEGTSFGSLSGDSRLIRRLVKNIFENASRFAKAAVQVTLEEKGEHLIVTVFDDGAGMNREDIEGFGKARGRRLVDESDLSHVSLGLGSVIMKKIVNLHHGEIFVTSSRAAIDPLPNGTRIVIRFPRFS